MVVSIVFILLVIAGAIAGSILGFGKCLKFVTKGWAGVIIAAVFCIIFGDPIRHFPPIEAVVQDSVLRIVVYYIILFVSVQFIRFFATFLIEWLLELDNPAMNVINRVGGCLAFGGLIFFVGLALLAAVSYLETEGFWFLDDAAVGIRDSLFSGNNPIAWLYRHNFLQYGSGS